MTTKQLRDPTRAEQKQIIQSAHTLRDDMLAAVKKALDSNPHKDYANAVVGHAISCMIETLEPNHHGLSKGLIATLVLEMTKGGATSGVIRIDMGTEDDDDKQTKH